MLTVNYLLDCLHHGETHVNTECAMILRLDWRTGDTVIAVAQDLNPQLVVLLGESVEAGKQLVEHLHEVRRRVLGRNGGKAHNVRVQDAGELLEEKLFN